MRRWIGTIVSGAVLGLLTVALPAQAEPVDFTLSCFSATCVPSCASHKVDWITLMQGPHGDASETAKDHTFLEVQVCNGAVTNVFAATNCSVDGGELHPTCSPFSCFVKESNITGPFTVPLCPCGCGANFEAIEWVPDGPFQLQDLTGHECFCVLNTSNLAINISPIPDPVQFTLNPAVTGVPELAVSSATAPVLLALGGLLLLSDGRSRRPQAVAGKRTPV